MTKGGQHPIPIESDLSASFNTIDHTLLLTSFIGSKWEQRGVWWIWGAAPGVRVRGRLILRPEMGDLGKAHQPKWRRRCWRVLSARKGVHNSRPGSPVNGSQPQLSCSGIAGRRGWETGGNASRWDLTLCTFSQGLMTMAGDRASFVCQTQPHSDFLTAKWGTTWAITERRDLPPQRCNRY